MRLLAAAALGMFAMFALPETASAIQLSGELKPPKGAPEDTFISCAHASAEVLRWTPAAGPLGAYLADAFAEHAALFVAIGYDDTGFWSADVEPSNGGCDSCSSMTLRHTSFSGAVLASHVVARGYDYDPEPDPAKRRESIKRKIFAVAKGPLDLAALRQDFSFNLPKHDAEGTIEKFTGWFAEIKKKDGALLRFAVVSTPVMCFCPSSWKAYTLAAPKKK